MSTFRLPDLGEGLQEAEIVAWHVAPGDHVVADQPLVAVETEKAVVEIPAPHAGRIAHLRAALHDRVKVGAPLVDYEEGAHADAGAIVGELGGDPGPAALPAAAPSEQRRAAAAPPGAAKAAPAIRALAQRRGIDLAMVTPTGPGGSVSRADVEAACARAGQAQPEPVRGVRRAMAEAMARAGAAVVPATVSDDADIEAWPAAPDVTARLVRAVAAGCAAAPALNAWFDGAAMTRRLHDRVDLGIAVDTPDGLIVPVLRDAGGLDAPGLRAALDAVKAATRGRSVPLADLRGATITLSNFGMLAGRYAQLAIVPPQVAILGAGRIRPTVVPAAGGTAVHRMLPLSLTFDHRAVTGGEAARFLAAVIADAERAT